MIHNKLWLALAIVCLLFVELTFAEATPGVTLTPTGLRCEYRVDPLGIDVLRPRVAWILQASDSSARGLKQSAYRIVVASSLDLLNKDQGDLWDSGKVLSDQTAQIEYCGSALISRQVCVWKVMVWNQDDQASAWSETARWSMGLLNPKDWHAHWISDPTLANPANRPLTPIHCYRSELASQPNTPKWIAVDLGSSRKIDMINLVPARPSGLNSDFRTIMFPVRFKIEVGDDADFLSSQVVVDQTAADFNAPRVAACEFRIAAVSARYVRLVVTKLAKWDGQDYAMALGGLTVNADGKLGSGDAHVTCSDSTESSDYSVSYLGRDKQAVALASDSKAVTVDFPGVPTQHTVSRVPMLRREFTLDAAVSRATLYVSARGFYEFHLNGQRVSDELLDPGYTDYSDRIAYQTFDVTSLLHPGENAMGALLAYGWYAGHMNLFELRCIDGFFPQFLAQLEIDLVDGRHIMLNTDGQWRTTLSGPILWSDLLDGEGYDSQKELPGWDKPGFKDDDWTSAWSQPQDEVALVWPRCQPITGDSRNISRLGERS